MFDVKGTIVELIGHKSTIIALTSALYSISAFMQREHLFVWSVFAPKLIYQMAAIILQLLTVSGLFLIHKLV